MLASKKKDSINWLSRSVLMSSLSTLGRMNGKGFISVTVERKQHHKGVNSKTNGLAWGVRVAKNKSKETESRALLPHDEMGHSSEWFLEGD